MTDLPNRIPPKGGSEEDMFYARDIELRMAAISGISGGGVAAALIFVGKALGWV